LKTSLEFTQQIIEEMKSGYKETEAKIKSSENNTMNLKCDNEEMFTKLRKNLVIDGIIDQPVLIPSRHILTLLTFCLHPYGTLIYMGQKAPPSGLTLTLPQNLPITEQSSVHVILTLKGAMCVGFRQNFKSVTI